MPRTLYKRTTVQPEGKVEFSRPELEVGHAVDVLWVQLGVTRSTEWVGDVELEVLNIGGDRA